MVQLIVGKKGKGKTKQLLDKVNAEVKTANGNIVYIDKSTAADRTLCRRKKHPRGLPRRAGDRPGIRRGARKPRKRLSRSADPDQAAGRRLYLRRTGIGNAGRTLPLVGRTTRHAAGLSRSDGRRRRRTDHGIAPHTLRRARRAVSPRIGAYAAGLCDHRKFHS